MATESQYAAARVIFLQFKAGLEGHDDLLRELLAALGMLLSERSTSF